MLATETGEAGVFGKSRIVPGSGAICISQRQFGSKFQMINPHKDVSRSAALPLSAWVGMMLGDLPNTVTQFGPRWFPAG